jgi:hypothetical protein
LKSTVARDPDPMLSRRQLLQRGGALAAGFALPVAPDFGAGDLRKLIDIGPGGVISPGSPQDYRAYSNRTYFADTQTGWIRMWADWPSLQPSQAYRIDDPASPGYAKLQALDAQIGQACADGLRVLLLPYRHPTWANGTSQLVPDSDAEIAFEPADRMSSPAWDKYVANGRVSSPSRRALEYRVPAEGYPLDGSWSRFFEFLYRRYHWGQRASGRYVHGFELVNEPNLQLWPQRAPSATGDPFALSALTIGRTVAGLMRTAQEVSARFGHTTRLYAPSSSDSERGSRLVTTYEDFTRDLLDAFPATGYAPHSQQAWSLHNYGDVEQRVTTRTQRVRDLLRWRWTGYAEPGAPTVFVTEGGARIGKMRKLYPREEPLLAQATSLQTAWSLHSTDAGGGAGVAMLAQYLLYADPNYDCGLLEPAPAAVKRPAYAAWKTFPRGV